MDLMQEVAKARAENDHQRVVDLIPYARTLNMDFYDAPEGLVFRLRYQEANIGNPNVPALHGGVIGAFMEHAGIFHILWHNETDVLPRVIDFSIDYLRPGRPEDTYALCRVWRQGKRVANVAVEAWQGDPDKPIATARAHFLLSPPAGAAHER